MLIGIYVICKNEKDFIERCLQSVEDADVIVVCDTGSTDGTLEILYDLAKLNPKILVKPIYVNPWRFDDAKNAALFSLPSNIEIAISLDADEMLEPGWYDTLTAEIKRDGKVFDRYYHRFKTIWDWQTNGVNVSEHWHERIHSRHGYRWKLPVHEVLVKGDGTAEDIKWLENILMIQQPDTFKSRSSYLPLLEQSSREDTKIWKTFSFLANEYVNANRLPEAVKAIEHALSIENSDKAFLSYTLSTIHQREDKWDLAVNQLNNACQYAPHVREYVVYLAHLYIKLGRKSDALTALNRASSITQKTSGYEYNSSCWGDQFDALLKEHWYEF